MPINFHEKRNRQSYALREADRSWREAIQEMVNVSGLNVLDIGSGGGIYSRALAEMGAAHVTGVDFSQEMLEEARAQSQGYTQVEFVSGNALATGLPGEEYDLIVERALIHHLAQADLEEARAQSQGYTQVEFVSGNALATGLPGEEYDLIVERALIHHLAQADLEE